MGVPGMAKGTKGVVPFRTSPKQTIFRIFLGDLMVLWSFDWNAVFTDIVDSHAQQQRQLKPVSFNRPVENRVSSEKLPAV
jgi:hypothetical protein